MRALLFSSQPPDTRPVLAEKWSGQGKPPLKIVCVMRSKVATDDRSVSAIALRVRMSLSLIILTLCVVLSGSGT